MASTHATYVTGERVRVVHGPYADMEAQVQEVQADLDRLRLHVTLYGQAFPALMETWQVEKLS